MTRINRYILREVVWPAILSFVLICFTFVAGEVREQTNELATDFVRLTDFLRLILYFVPAMVAYILPVTLMMGILLAFSGLAQRNEITAMRAAGIPLKRLIVPVLLLGLVMGAVSFFLQDRAQPWGATQAKRLIFQEMVLRGTLNALPPGRMHSFDDGAWRIYFASKSPDGAELRDIDILRTSDDQQVTMFHAAAARVEYDGRTPRVVLEDGFIFRPSEHGQAISVFPRYTVEGPALQPRTRRVAREELSLVELLEADKTLERQYERYKTENLAKDLLNNRKAIATRLSFAIACFSVCLTAAPLAVRSRSGGKSYSFAIGLLIGLTYFLLFRAFEPSGLRSLTEVVVRAQLPNLLLCVAGIFLVWRVDRV